MLKAANTARRVLDNFIEDITGRSGFDGVWDGLDDDTHEMVKDDWFDLIYKELLRD